MISGNTGGRPTKARGWIPRLSSAGQRGAGRQAEQQGAAQAHRHDGVGGGWPDGASEDVPAAPHGGGGAVPPSRLCVRRPRLPNGG